MNGVFLMKIKIFSSYKNWGIHALLIFVIFLVGINTWDSIRPMKINRPGDISILGKSSKTNFEMTRLESPDHPSSFLKREWSHFGPEVRSFIGKYVFEISEEEITLAEIGELLYENGYKNAAQEIAEKALLNDPTDIQALIVLGKIYLDSGKLEDFRYKYREFLFRNHDGNDYYKILANFLNEVGDFEQARSLFEFGIEISPQNIQVRYAYGDFLEVNDLYYEAINLYLMALSLNEKDAEAYFKLGEVYQKIGEKDKSDYFFNIASQFSQDLAEVIRELKTIFLESS